MVRILSSKEAEENKTETEWVRELLWNSVFLTGVFEGADRETDSY